MSLYDLEIIDLDVFVKEGKVVDAKCSGNKVRGFEKSFIGKDANTFYELLPRVLATCSQSEIKEGKFESEKFDANDGNYISFAESIRGSLIHKYEIEKGRITSYKIIQPTTFIASPKGALESAVIGLPIKDPKNPTELSLTVSSLDTCFVTMVRVYENDKLVTTKRIGGFC